VSWTIHGVTYHNYNEYQRALRGENTRQAQRETEQLRKRLKKIEKESADLAERNEASLRENRKLERDFEQARGDIQRQRQITTQLQANVAGIRETQERMATAVTSLERTQAQLASALEESEARAERQFGEIRREAERNFARVHCRIDAAEADIAALEQEHQAHVQEVRQTFQEVRGELEQGLARAEQRRRESEQRLQGEIEKVEAKVEEDRRARLAEKKSESDRAAEQLRLVEATLVQCESRLARLNLEEEAQGIRDQVAQASALCARGDTASALAVGHGAYGQGRSLVYRTMKREAELAEGRRRVLERIDGLRATLAGESQVERFFAGEARQAGALLDRLGERARTSYLDHRRLQLDLDADDKTLDRLDRQIGVMVTTAPEVSRLAQERKGRAEGLVRQLKQVYGPLSSVQQRFADEQDRKSDLLVECDFGGARVDLQMNLDGTYAIDGYGHESNLSCQQQGTAVVKSVARENVVAASRVDSQNRSQPAAPPAAGAKPAWDGVGEGLGKIEDRF
jgi:hypothetical protein